MKISAAVHAIRSRVEDTAVLACLSRLQLRLEMIDNRLHQLTPAAKVYDLEYNQPYFDRDLNDASTAVTYLSGWLSGEDEAALIFELNYRKDATHRLYNTTEKSKAMSPWTV